MESTDKNQGNIGSSLTEVGKQLSYPLDFVTQEILKSVSPQAWPIGSVFISLVSTNPSALLGYGVWVAFGAGRVIVGIDSGDSDFDTVRDTYGSKTHTLTTAEMPAHTHAGVLNDNGGAINPGAGGGFAIGDTDSTGGGGSHNNVQPSIVAYMWERTA